MEQGVYEQLELLKKDNAFKDKLLTIIGHDLRSPLGNIKAAIALLREGSTSEEDREKLMGMLESVVDTSLLMLENLLDWAAQKYYGGVLNIKTKQEKLQLSELVDKAISFANHHADKKSISIINKIPYTARVQCDLQQILFVLRNLINNAVKFSYMWEQVTVDAQMGGDKYEVSVSDNGMGISQERMQSLFQIDRRASQEGTGKEKGAGLALIMCKDFVENNGGRIWAENNANQGTTFKFTLNAAYTAHKQTSRLEFENL
jgi:K+-sensing histidine kinase KdpD